MNSLIKDQSVSSFSLLNEILENNNIIEYDILLEEKEVDFVCNQNRLGIGKKVYEKLVIFSSFHFLKLRKNCSDKDFLRKLSRCLLLFVPDHLTAWNFRKELIENINKEKEAEVEVEEDLKLTKLILTKHPKSCEVFSHRKWLLNKILEKFIENKPKISQYGDKEGNCEICGRVRGELEVCSFASFRYSNNYFAWVHRLWSLQLHRCPSTHQLWLDELEKTTKIINSQISDYSGYHHNQQIISHLINSHHGNSEIVNFNRKQKNFIVELVEKESEKIIELSLFYGGDSHECFFYHKKYFICLILELLGKNEKKILKEKLKFNFETEDKKKLENILKKLTKTETFKHEKDESWSFVLKKKFEKWCVDKLKK